MPTAAQVSDVENLTGADYTSATTRVEALLERAERTVLADMPGFTLGEVDDATVTVEGSGDSVLVLPYYPVRSVASVTIAGTPLAADEFTVDRLGNLRRLYSGEGNPHTYDGYLRPRCRWPDAGVDIVVVYSYGEAASATPGVVRDVVAELAAGRLVNPTQVAQKSLGDRSVAFGAGGANADGLTSEQRHRLRHWRRNRVASARVRS